MLLSRSLSALRVAAVLSVVAASPCLAAAQTLARPGWAGSGIAADAWWRTAVFYRVDVRHFQDSGADGEGDLKGLADRFDYLQSLGVDAVVLLATPGETGGGNAGVGDTSFDEAGFDALRREGTGRRIRIVVGLDPAAGREALVPLARQWLTRGAAGVYLQRPAAAASPAPAPAEIATLLRDLRSLADTFPGQRVVLSEAAPFTNAPITSLAPRGGRSPRSGTAQLTDVQIVSGADVLQREMSDFDNATDSAPLLLTDARFRSANAFYAEAKAEQLGRNKILATVLLSFRGAVSLRYGQELGLAAEVGGAAPLTMQWTPANVTPKPAAAEAPATPADPNIYGAYVPYVKPKPKGNGTGSGSSAGVDPDSLKGFTSGDLTESLGRSNRALANVALEDADPGSLLNYYRRLVQLHHGNSSIRSGAVHILHAETDAGSGSTLLWMRRAPAGSRTAANVVVACNLGEKPMRLSVDHELERLHIGAGTLRPLLASWTEIPAAQTTGNITLPPYSVFVGELFHAGR